VPDRSIAEALGRARARLAEALGRARARLAEALARARARLAEALARRRVPLGFAAAMVVLLLARPTRATIPIGAAIACVGEGLRVWAAGHLNKSREVTASGPYRWFAHPLYVGSSIMGAGLAVASGSLVVAVIIAAYVGTTIPAAIAREESFLRATFGDGYDRYRRAGVVDASRRFSLAQAMANREYRALIGLALAILLLALKATYNGSFGGQPGG
jgi:protein-S-isoprenylcysteine O-methyltransferase Ste14